MPGPGGGPHGGGGHHGGPGGGGPSGGGPHGGPRGGFGPPPPRPRPYRYRWYRRPRYYGGGCLGCILTFILPVVLLIVITAVIL